MKKQTSKPRTEILFGVPPLGGSQTA